MTRIKLQNSDSQDPEIKNFIGREFTSFIKRIMALVVSFENRCHFCVNIHQSNLLKQGFSEEKVSKNLDI